MLDIKTQILKIKWPGQKSPAALPNFESLARKYRFRLLGTACRDLGINSLLLAHHEDDQAETILMRLAQGQGASGLVGIRNPAGIPECYGIHGVYESGGYDSTRAGNVDQGKKRDPASFNWARPGSFIRSQLPIETGGIQIFRPFLNFGKARLVATCVAENMEWFEDHTNAEPTTTLRNTVRHMYLHHPMPAALTKPALLALSTRLNDTAVHRFDVTKSWLARCKVTRFETRLGTVRIQFADLNQLRVSDNVWPPLHAGRIAAEVLRQIILLVTPQEHVGLSSLHSAVFHVFPEVCPVGGQRLQTTAFTASRVYFQPVETTSFRGQSSENQKCEWLLSRQPYPSKSLPKLRLDSPVTRGSWSPWHLYDGRYWIRVQNLGSGSLFIQPFREEHLAGFRAALTRDDKLQLTSILRKEAPGNVRWTLPAILRKGKDGKETPIALPSLDLSVSGSQLRWEIRYKKIYYFDLAEIKA